MFCVELHQHEEQLFDGQFPPQVRLLIQKIMKNKNRKIVLSMFMFILIYFDKLILNLIINKEKYLFYN